MSLKEVVLPQLLQEAFNTVSPRFPTLVAGIQRGSFHHIVVPVSEVPNIEQDHALLAYMPPQQITRCAMRVLYGPDGRVWRKYIWARFVVAVIAKKKKK